MRLLYISTCLHSYPSWTEIRFQPHSHFSDVVSLCHFYGYYYNALYSSVVRPHEFELTTRLANWSHRFTVKITRCHTHFAVSCLSDTYTQTVSAKSIAVSVFINSVILLSFLVMKFRSFSATLSFALVGLSPCLDWNYKKKQKTKQDCFSFFSKASTFRFYNTY